MKRPAKKRKTDAASRSPAIAANKRGTIAPTEVADAKETDGSVSQSDNRARLPTKANIAARTE